MKIKSSLLLTIFIFLTLFAHSQQAQKFVLIDSAKGRGYEIEKGEVIKLKTDSIGYLGELKQVTKEYVTIGTSKIYWEDINSITFQDKEILKTWKKITFFSILANIAISSIAFADSYGSGYAGMIFLFITIPFFILSGIFMLWGYLLYKKGRTIKYKK